MYDIYKRKYNKEIDRLSAKDEIKLNYKQLALMDEYLYSPEEEQEKKDKKQEKKEEQDEKPFNLDEFIEQTLNKEKLPINSELFKKHFKREKPIFMHKVLHETRNDKEKIVN